MTGEEMHGWIRDLLPYPRSIMGDGVRRTLGYLAARLPGRLEINEIPTGTRAYDWVVPPEWSVREAWIEDPTGKRIIDLADSNLHVVGYSEPIDAVVSRDTLDKHLYSDPTRPDAIPYVTSYYEGRWGFCIQDRVRSSMVDADYRVKIDSGFKYGSLTYGELLLPRADGEDGDTVLISTYVCHPAMANDNLSGPVVATALARWIASEPRRLAYRFVFVPETIGAITYLRAALEWLRGHIIAGFVLTCVGDERAYSLVRSRRGDTLADRVAHHVLSRRPCYQPYSFLARGSDERQYCAPGIDLPIVAVCRSKFGEFPEYHTSDDNLELVTPAGLEGSYEAMKQIVTALERNRRYRATCVGEPQLSHRGLYPTLSRRSSADAAKLLLDVLAYADGETDLLEVADRLGRPIWELYPVIDRMPELVR